MTNRSSRFVCCIRLVSLVHVSSWFAVAQHSIRVCIYSPTFPVCSNVHVCLLSNVLFCLLTFPTMHRSRNVASSQVWSPSRAEFDVGLLCNHAQRPSGAPLLVPSDAARAFCTVTLRLGTC